MASICWRDLLQGDERRVWGDSAYPSQKTLIRQLASHAKNFTNQRIRKWGEVDEAGRAQPQQIVDPSTGRARLRGGETTMAIHQIALRGLDKNADRSFVALGLANLYLARTRVPV